MNTLLLLHVYNQTLLFVYLHLLVSSPYLIAPCTVMDDIKLTVSIVEQWTGVV